MGQNIFVLAAHKKWGAVPAGAIPAHLYRSFRWKGDRLGMFRMDAEYTWCLGTGPVSAVGLAIEFELKTNAYCLNTAPTRRSGASTWVVGLCTMPKRNPWGRVRSCPLMA